MKSIMACVACCNCSLSVENCVQKTISASNSLRFNVTQSVSWEQQAWKSGNQVYNVIMAEHTNEWSKLYLALFICNFSTEKILIQVINPGIKYWILCQNAVSSENFLTLPTSTWVLHQMHHTSSEKLFITFKKWRLLPYRNVGEWEDIIHMQSPCRPLTAGVKCQHSDLLSCSHHRHDTV